MLEDEKRAHVYIFMFNVHIPEFSVWQNGCPEGVDKINMMRVYRIGECVACTRCHTIVSIHVSETVPEQENSSWW